MRSHQKAVVLGSLYVRFTLLALLLLGLTSAGVGAEDLDAFDQRAKKLAEQSVSYNFV